MKRIYLPTESAEDWKNLLADPVKQWKSGYSAKSLAYEWESATGFPQSVVEVFQDAMEPKINTLKQLFSFPEYKVKLPGGTRPSQNDLYVLAKNLDGLMCIMVEGKVEEPFDKKVIEWAENVKEGIDNIRLQYLIDTLDLSSEKNRVLEVRYQLLHRTASAIIEAKRIGAMQAMMMVHSYSENNSWFDDYSYFLSLFGLVAKVNGVSEKVDASGIDLYFSWVKGDIG